MNWVNIFFILLIGLAVLEGLNRGFLHSAINLGAFFLSIFTSYLLYPVVSTAVHANNTIFKFLEYYTEGAEKMAHFEDTHLLIDTLSPAKLDSIISSADLVAPYTTLIRQNVEAKAFAKDGLFEIGQYFNMTIVCTVLNILSFIAVFFLARIVYSFVLGIIGYTVQFPQLKQYDRVAGGVFGASRGVLVCFLIVTIMPVILLVIPVSQISEYFQGSSLGVFFLNNNFILHLISGTV